MSGAVDRHDGMQTNRVRLHSEEPADWVAAYVGLPWIEGEADCWAFARRVWRERFGWDIPAIAVPATPRAGLEALRDAPELAAWDRVDICEEGDAVLMAQGRRPSHVGVMVAPRHVLHAVRGTGAICTRLDRVGEAGFRVLGCYRRRACRPPA